VKEKTMPDLNNPPAIESPEEAFFAEFSQETPEPATVSTEVPPAASEPVPTLSPAPGVQPVPSAQPQALTPAVGQVVPPVSQPVVAPAPVVQQPPTVAQPVAQPDTEGSFSTEEVMTRRTALVGQIQSKYTVSEADRELLMTDPSAVLPKFAANIIVDAYDMVMSTMFAQIPQLIDSHTQQVQSVQQHQNQFFEKWPALRHPQALPLVQQTARLYRSMNPNATFEQMVEDVGMQLHFKLRIPLPGQAPVAAVPTPSPRPFIPAAPGGAARTANQPTPDDFWAQVVSTE
jgi:hypothetical protein